MVESHANSVDDYLIEGLSFKLSPGASYVTNRRSVSFFPSGSDTYSPTSGVKVIKIKFNDFKLMTAEIQSSTLNLEQFLSLFTTLYARNTKPIRLLGLGISFKEQHAIPLQLTLF